MMKVAEDSVAQASEYAAGSIHESKNLRMYKSSVKTQAAVADHVFNVFLLHSI